MERHRANGINSAVRPSRRVEWCLIAPLGQQQSQSQSQRVIIKRRERTVNVGEIELM